MQKKVDIARFSDKTVSEYLEWVHGAIGKCRDRGVLCYVIRWLSTYLHCAMATEEAGVSLDFPVYFLFLKLV